MNSKLFLIGFTALLVGSVVFVGAEEEKTTIFGEVVSLYEGGEFGTVMIDEGKAGLIPKFTGRRIFITPKEEALDLRYYEGRKIRAEGVLRQSEDGRWMLDLTAYQPMIKVSGRLQVDKTGMTSKVRLLVDTERNAVFKKGASTLLVSPAQGNELPKMVNDEEVMALGFLSVTREGVRQLDIIEHRVIEECHGKITLPNVFGDIELYDQNRHINFRLIPSENTRELWNFKNQNIHARGFMVQHGDQWFFHVLEYTSPLYTPQNPK